MSPPLTFIPDLPLEGHPAFRRGRSGLFVPSSPQHPVAPVLLYALRLHSGRHHLTASGDTSPIANHETTGRRSGMSRA
jgi:hypothetical protein